MKDPKMEPGSSSSSSGEEDSIKVFVRVRPSESSNSALPCGGRVVEVPTNNTLTLLSKPESKLFTFDQVHDCSSSQESVFCSTGKSLIESCISGYNGTIFAYGQTGSGKTFTMLGQSEECDNFQHELRGVIPRSFEHLFNLIAREQELHGERKQFLCKCTFLEIYQENVYDLLDPAANNLQLRENIKKGVFVDGLMEQVVTTPTEAYQALSCGWLNRRVAATSMNRESSRSHAVFTLCIESKEEKSGVKNLRQSVLNLVDLAGSERQKDTNTIGIRLKEAGKINQSLSVLGNVIMSLVKISQGRAHHIPYRDSKLTFLLRDSLGGNAKTSIIACVHPDAKCFGETLSTLNFAKRAKLIKNKAVINEDTQGNVAHLQTEIRRLRDLLSSHQGGGDVPRPMSVAVAVAPEDGSQPTLQGPDWRARFFQAMLFREKSQQEQEMLRQQLGIFDDRMKKMDRTIQSSRLIIKFRESTIAKLEKASKDAGAQPAEDPAASNKLTEDVVSLKGHLDQYPKVAQLDGQLHGLKAQLAEARIRLNAATGTLLDADRLALLEAAFTQLQAASRRESLVGSPRSGDAGHSSASIQKLREKVKGLEEETQQLKKQAVEERQGWEGKACALQAELTAANKMTSDLEHLLEANTLKQRLHNQALSTQHAHTIKALTPSRDPYDLRPRNRGSDGSDPNASMEVEQGEEDILNEAPPVSMGNAHQALTEEIQKLQRDKNSLQERLEEYETDMLRLQQKANQTELERESLSEMLSKEQRGASEKLEKDLKELCQLRGAVDSLTTDLKMAKEEVKDYQLLLQSSDKELKSEKAKVKAHSSTINTRINKLETQLLQAHGTMETLGRQLEDESQACEDMLEKLEVERSEKMFLQQQLQDVETALREKNRDQLSARSNFQEEQQMLQQQVETMTQELEAAKRNVQDSQVALQQQLERVQELRGAVSEKEERCCHLQDQVDSGQAQVTDAKQQCEALNVQLQARQAELDSATVQSDMMTEDLAFFQEQNHKNVEECDVLRHALEALEKEKALLETEAQSLKAEVGERDGRLEAITLHLKELQLQQASSSSSPLSPAASPLKAPEVSGTGAGDEVKLASMVEQLTKDREAWMDQNQQLKSEMTALRAEVTGKEDLSKECQDLRCQLENQATVFKESMHQMQEDTQAERGDLLVLKESLSEAQRQQEAFLADKQLMLAQCDEAQTEKNQAEEEMNRLRSVLEHTYKEKDAHISQMEELKQELRKTKEELVESESRTQELAEFNAVLAGHGNHKQKINYLAKLTTDFNMIREKYDEVAKENCNLRSQMHPSPLRDRKNTQPMTNPLKKVV